jgi:hypothetical protein
MLDYIFSSPNYIVSGILFNFFLRSFGTTATISDFYLYVLVDIYMKEVSTQSLDWQGGLQSICLHDICKCAFSKQIEKESVTCTQRQKESINERELNLQTDKIRRKD